MVAEVSKKIVLVDDDRFLLDMYTKKFTNSGYEVKGFNNGEDAIQYLSENEDIDVFLFDIIMPQMDGLELISKVKEQNLIPNATKVVLTNQGQQSDIDKAEEIGVNGYIVKAMHTPSEVVKMVEEFSKK